MFQSLQNKKLKKIIDYFDSKFINIYKLYQTMNTI